MADNPDERDRPDAAAGSAPGPGSPEPGPPERAADDQRTAELPVTDGRPPSGEPPVTEPVRAADAGPANEPADTTARPGGDRPETTGPALANEPIDRPGTTARDGAVTSTFDIRAAERERGAHEAERPVPRSGLAEHHSARYLTGERPPETEAPTGDRTVDGGSTPWPSTGATAAGAPTTDHPADTADDGGRREDVDRPGRDAPAAPRRRRTGTHVLVLLLTLLLTPVAWYLLADAGARLTLPAGNPWDSGNVNVAAVLELVGGLAVLAVVLLAARSSSLGAIVAGILVLAAGVPFVAAPAWTQEVLEPATQWLRDLGDFGGNVAHHLVASGSTGRLVVAGLALVLLGVVARGARRRGRHEVSPEA